MARASAVTVEELRAMVQGCPATTSGIRDRAILLLTFAGALRRSEVVGLDLRDLTVTATGSLRVALPKRTIEIQPSHDPILCPVRAVEAWGVYIADGPLFRRVHHPTEQISRSRLTAQSVRLIVSAAAARAGLGHRTAHGLRLGHAETAKAAGRSKAATAAFGGWGRIR